MTTHWDGIYLSKAADELSWFQSETATSQRLLLDASSPASVIDVGAGQSTLVDALLERGIEDVTLVDVSVEALESVRARLGTKAQSVEFIVADLRMWRPTRRWQAWHDRAVFHFLVDSADRAAYVGAAAAAVEPGGVAVVATFALDGPTVCSGLPTARYDAAGLAAEFAPAFQLEASEVETHTTPWGATQSFTWVVLRRCAVG